jgi:hypothetical protein
LDSPRRFDSPEDDNEVDQLSMSQHSTASSPVLGGSITLDSLTEFLRSSLRRSNSFNNDSQQLQNNTRPKGNKRLASIDVTKPDDSEMYANQSLEDLWARAREKSDSSKLDDGGRCDDGNTDPTSSSSTEQLNNDSSATGSFSIRW